MLAGVRAQHPSIPLAPIMHWSPDQPLSETFFWEVDAEAEYAADACELNEIVKWCNVDEQDS